MSASDRSVERTREIADLVLAAVAEVGGLERAALSADTPLFEANVDSLTLVAVIARLELALDVRFDDEESAQLVEARDASEICAIVGRKAAAVGR
jgi:acyl carrier protein